MMAYINLILAAVVMAGVGWFAFYLSDKERANRRKTDEGSDTGGE
jgi:uncharacterized membrane protein YsdA (DUF1294 family)